MLNCKLSVMFKVLLQDLPGRTTENHKKYQSS